MVEHQLPKLRTGFRLPSPALLKTGRSGRFFPEMMPIAAFACLRLIANVGTTFCARHGDVTIDRRAAQCDRPFGQFSVSVQFENGYCFWYPQSMAKGSTQTDICIIGAGPHGLAAAVHLRQADPNLTITTIDRRPSWLTTWSEQFARAEIKTLRSPAIHHPAPDPYALPDFIRSQGLAQSGLPYNLCLRAVLPLPHRPLRP